MKAIITTLTLLVSALLATPAALAVPPVCFGPAPSGTFGPVTIESYGINCTTVQVDDEWSFLPDEGVPDPWQGGVAVCADATALTPDTCRHVTWSCLGGETPKVKTYAVEGLPAHVVLNLCTPGPHPGPMP